MSTSYHSLHHPTTTPELPRIICTDLDAFLTGIYRYWQEKGLRSVTYQSLLNLVASIFTYLLCVVVLFLVDWAAVVNCTEESACRDATGQPSTLLFVNPFDKMTFVRFIIFIQLVLLGTYTVVLASLSCVAKIREAVKVSEFYQSGLGIKSDEELVFLTWEQLVQKLVQYQRDPATPPLCIVQDELSELDITNIVMRTDNSLLGILKRFLAKVDTEQEPSWMTELVLGSATVRWLVQYGLVAWLFDDRYRIACRGDRLPQSVHGVPNYETIDSIRSRLRVMGSLSLLFIFPIFIFGSILLFVQESANLKRGNAAITDTEWTSLAKCYLRHFSEMEHDFQDRLDKGRPSLQTLTGTDMLYSLSSPKPHLIKSFIFIFGGILAVLAIIGLVQDKAIMYMVLTAKGHNLFYYLAVCSVLFGVLIKLDTSSGDSISSSIGERINALLQFTVHSHEIVHSVSFMRDEGDGSACNPVSPHRQCKVIDSFLFKHRYGRNKIIIFLQELFSILSIPYVFYFKLISLGLPESVERFLATGVTEHPFLGDFAKAGWLLEDTGREVELVAGDEIGAPSGRSAGKSIDSMFRPELASSILSFWERYPASCAWSEQQVKLIERVSEFRDGCLSQLAGLDSHTPSLTTASLSFWYVLYRDVYRRTGGPASTLDLHPQLLAAANRAISQLV